MATIESLARDANQDDATTDGNTVTGTELWILQLSGNATQVEANRILNNLNDGNVYGWMEIGVTPHPDDSSIFSTGFSVAREGDLLSMFKISTTITNDTDLIRLSSGAVRAQPVFDYPEVDILVEVDISPITGNAIAASNGEAYFPKLLRKDTLTRIVINRNETRYDPREARKFRNKLNKTSLNIDGRGYDARELLLESWTGKTAIDGRGREYYQVKYELLYNPDGHKIVLIDVATGPDLNGTFPQIKSGVENKPYKLDGSGVYMIQERQENPSDFETQEFFVHDEISMKSLAL